MGSKLEALKPLWRCNSGYQFADLPLLKDDKRYAVGNFLMRSKVSLGGKEFDVGKVLHSLALGIIRAAVTTIRILASIGNRSVELDVAFRNNVS